MDIPTAVQANVLQAMGGSTLIKSLQRLLTRVRNSCSPPCFIIDPPPPPPPPRGDLDYVPVVCYACDVSGLESHTAADFKLGARKAGC